MMKNKNSFDFRSAGINYVSKNSEQVSQQIEQKDEFTPFKDKLISNFQNNKFSKIRKSKYQKE